RSTVHRPGQLDYVGIKRFNDKGEVIGETRFLGLYTHTAYSENPMQVPLLRRKLGEVIERAGLLPAGYSGKALASILESYPRDELLQIGAEDLYRHAAAILQLGDRQRLRLLMRQDPYARFVSCLIFVPRDRYNTELRQRFQRILTEAFNGASSEFDVDLSAATLGRILMRIRTRPGEMTAQPDLKALEQRLVEAMRRWEDDLHAALVERHGEERAASLFRVYGHAFPAGYRDEYPVESAVTDIEMIESLAPQPDLGMNLYAPQSEPGILHFKIYRRGSRVPLSDSLPMLERLGVRVFFEHPHRVEPAGSPPVRVVDFGLALPSGALPLEQVREHFHEAFLGSFLAVIQATTRTNFFQGKTYLSLKLDPKRVPGLPEPRPMFEIWVYSPRVEAVHLRGSPVARGGIRWSDRMEDFRTEVLGLMKAQMVKNVVIVPVGAKGGFVLKQPPAGDREALMKEGVACYQTFLRGMLDVTDNRVDGKVVPPRRKVW